MRLTDHDASFLYGETASGPMHGATLYILDGEVSFDAIYQHVESRLHLVPRYRQRLAFVPFNLAHPKWVDDPNFDLANHVKPHNLLLDRSGRLFLSDFGLARVEDEPGLTLSGELLGPGQFRHGTVVLNRHEFQIWIEVKRSQSRNAGSSSQIGKATSRIGRDSGSEQQRVEPAAMPRI